MPFVENESKTNTNICTSKNDPLSLVTDIVKSESTLPNLTLYHFTEEIRDLIQNYHPMKVIPKKLKSLPCKLKYTSMFLFTLIFHDLAATVDAPSAKLAL